MNQRLGKSQAEPRKRKREDSASHPLPAVTEPAETVGLPASGDSETLENELECSICRDLLVSAHSMVCHKTLPDFCHLMPMTEVVCGGGVLEFEWDSGLNSAAVIQI